MSKNQDATKNEDCFSGKVYQPCQQNHAYS